MLVNPALDTACPRSMPETKGTQILKIALNNNSWGHSRMSAQFNNCRTSIILRTKNLSESHYRNKITVIILRSQRRLAKAQSWDHCQGCNPYWMRSTQIDHYAICLKWSQNCNLTQRSKNFARNSNKFHLQESSNLKPKNCTHLPYIIRNRALN